MYDPAICRFTGVDPIADQFAWVSPYNYAENEPVNNIDLHGLQKAGNIFERLSSWLGFSYSPAGTRGDNSPRSARQAQQQESAREVASEVNDAVSGAGEAATWTDANDFAVLSTATTGDPKNIDGSDASWFDVGLAAVGFVLPYVSGSGASKGLKKLGEFVSTEVDVQDGRKVANMADEFSSAQTQEEFTKMVLGSDGPIRVIDDNGVMLIDDGHHRVQAASQANTGFALPIQIVPVEETRFKTIENARAAANGH